MSFFPSFFSGLGKKIGSILYKVVGFFVFCFGLGLQIASVFLSDPADLQILQIK